jgi:hypothetical protein
MLRPQALAAAAVLAALRWGPPLDPDAPVERHLDGTDAP